MKIKLFRLTNFFKTERDILLALVALVIIAELIWSLDYLANPLPSLKSVIERVKPQPKTPVTLSLSPAAGGVKIGENFTVEVKLSIASDTATAGTDVVLTFDPQFLAVVDDNSEVKGVQIESGVLYPQVALNSVDNAKGEIKFSALIPLDQEPVKGGGTVAIITFKALKTGTTQTSFDFTPASTKDSNIAQPGTPKDSLEKVFNANWLIIE